MRRNDREVTDINEIMEIIADCDVCRLALNDDEYPYIIPLNFGAELADGKVTLYFHSALKGKKLDLIAADPRASFEMDSGHELCYSKERGYCTYAYESVAGSGTVTMLDDEQSKVHALGRLMEHYHRSEEAYYNPAAISRTAVYKLTADKVTAKRNTAPSR